MRSSTPPAATSSSVISIAAGTPSATPEAEPKLDVMSLRTTPLSVSAFGPFEPSPGNGPAVSSGISVVDEAGRTRARGRGLRSWPHARRAG
jgi:hypothetical protein